MRILYFAAHELWPANTGARLRDYQLARYLAARSSLTFLEMGQAREERLAFSKCASFKSLITLEREQPYTVWKVLRGLAGPTPVTLLNCWSPKMEWKLAEALRSSTFDTVQIEGVHLLEYLPMIRKFPMRPAILADWHNIESELMSRFGRSCTSYAKKAAAWRTAKLIERVENRLLRDCDAHTVTSERERQKLLARCPAANIQVIPNGVDAAHYSADARGEVEVRSRERHTKDSILFVGSMDYHANSDAVQWFARCVWPAILRKHPDLHFYIVGRDPSPEVRALVTDHIHVTGTVEDVRTFYMRAVAAVVPIRCGSGTRLKILEAMAAGVSVISTRLGAEGIDVEDDVHLLMADSSIQIAEAVDRIVSSPETRARLSAAARNLVVKHYDWSVSGHRLYQIHRTLMQSRESDPQRLAC